MRNKSVFILVLLFSGGFWAFQPNSFAQKIVSNTLIFHKAEIEAFTPQAVNLQAGGPSAIVALEGKYLEGILSVQVIKGGVKIKEIPVQFVAPWPGSQQLKLQAAANAPVAKGYQLRVIGKAGMAKYTIDVPPQVFSLEIVGRHAAAQQIQVQSSSLPTLEQPLAKIGPDIQLLKVDLMVFNPGDSLYAADRPIYTHSRVRLNPHFKNIGNRPADLHNVGWQVVEGPILKGRVVSQQIILEPGSADSDVLEYFGPGQLAAGTYIVKVVFDNTCKIKELSESNNAAAVTFTVQPSPLYSGQPNLAFVGVVPTLISAAACGGPRRYAFDATAINSGTFPADINGNDVIQGDAPLKTDHNQGFTIMLLPGETKTIRFTASLPPGTSQALKFYADKWERLSESDESDNQFTLALQVPSLQANEIGDLVVHEAYFEYTPTNELYWLVVEIKNLGPATVMLCEGQRMWSTVNAPPDLGWAGSIPNYNVDVKPGDLCTPSTSARRSLPSGTFTITIRVDPDNLLPETDESNNDYSLTVTLPRDIRRR